MGGKASPVVTGCQVLVKVPAQKGLGSAMAISEYAEYDGVGLAELVAKKKVKPSELVEEAITRAERVNPKLNAIVFADYERARGTARSRLPKGPLSGAPFFLKDIFAFAEGMPT